MKRRTSDEKKNPSPTSKVAGIVYKDFMTQQKSRSPDNAPSYSKQGAPVLMFGQPQASMFKKQTAQRNIKAQSPENIVASTTLQSKQTSKSPTMGKPRGIGQTSPQSRPLLKKPSASKLALKSPTKPSSSQAQLPNLKQQAQPLKKQQSLKQPVGSQSTFSLATKKPSKQESEKDENGEEDNLALLTHDKKRTRELLRQLWSAAEKDDMMQCLKLLKSEDARFA